MSRLLLCLLVLLFSVKVLATSDIYQINGLPKEVRENSEKRLDSLLNQLPKPFNAEVKQQFLQQAPKNIIQAIEPYGYFKAKIKIGEASLSEKTLKKSGWRRWFSQSKPKRVIIFNVTPGPKLHINSVTLVVRGEGKNNLTIQRVIHDFRVKKSQVFLSEHYEKAKQSLFDATEHSGYLKPKMNHSKILIDLKRYSADIDIDFNTGRRYYFGPVFFHSKELSSEFLKRYVPFKPGSPYSTDAVIKLNDHLSGSGYFKSVTVNPQINGSKTIPIEVHSTARTHTTYSLGVGFGTDTGIRGKAGLSVIPVNEKGHKFQSFAQGSIKQNQLQAQYIIPGADPVIDQTSIGARLFNLDYNTGYSNAFQASLAHIHNKQRLQRTIALTALYERTTYTNQPRENTFLLYPDINLTWLKREALLFSPNMYNLSITGLGGSKSILSDISFAQATIDFKVAKQFLLTNTRFYVHGTQGATAVNSITDLPLSIAFLLGGTDNLKGYGYNSLGPGKIITFASLEVQQVVKKGWYLIGLYELGDVYDKSPILFKRDAGVGIMWVSPIGPVKLGFAQAIDSQFKRIEHTHPKFFLTMGPDL